MEKIKKTLVNIFLYFCQTDHNNKDNNLLSNIFFLLSNISSNFWQPTSIASPEEARTKNKKNILLFRTSALAEILKCK